MKTAGNVITKRYCSSGQHDAIDDGKGTMLPIGKNNFRWRCSQCNEKVKASKPYIANTTGKVKSKPGRKPEPRYDMDITDPQEDMEFVRRMFGI